ncbi:MAG TPA: DUF1287 domain-containing protein [Pyrinomonadaceae bacterium]|jgi:uncharacterized protein YijF (DUF1287 family)|nr:DUF1287 domain-containing protein [Pyrinomonadaceae bacterium]
MIFLSGCGASRNAVSSVRQSANQGTERATQQQTPTPRPSTGSPFLDQFVAAALDRTNQQVRYDATYFKIDYPGGDVPAEVGVCTDEVIRAYRKVGVDLQKEVHEDMKSNFNLYPRQWALSKPDTNIDHRRVPNLMVFFGRKGEVLPITDSAKDYAPGDIVTWDLGGGMTHIGIVVNVASDADNNRYMIVHNIGAGPKMEDALFSWKITGHYRYTGPPRPQVSRQPERVGRN